MGGSKIRLWHGPNSYFNSLAVYDNVSLKRILVFPMITLQELCLHLNGMLAAEKFTDLCPNGLQVEGKPGIERIATAVSASHEVIAAAVEAKADALIVHHGIFWQGDDPRIIGKKRAKLKILFDHGISLIAYHLPLDAHPTIGNNWKAAIDLDWQQLEPFGTFKGQLIGVKARINPTAVETFKHNLESYYRHPAHHAAGGKALVETVGLICGGAHWSIKEALAHNLDAFITGSFDEPIWNIAHEENIHFFALGHAATERVGPIALGHHLNSQFGLPCEFIDTINPF